MGIRKAGWGYPPPPPQPTTTLTNDSDRDGAPNVTFSREDAADELLGDVLLKVNEEGNIEPEFFPGETVSQEIFDVMDNVVAVWKELGLPTVVITSANDDVHSGKIKKPDGTGICKGLTEASACRPLSNSLHYSGNAVDIRSNNLGGVDPSLVEEKLRETTVGFDEAGIEIKLKELYDFQLHVDHFHLEFQPTSMGGNPGI